MITDQRLRAMMPNAGKRLDAHLPYIAPAMAEMQIDSPKRIAAFIAQLAHESGEYRYMEEIADGSAYEGRTDLGNTQPGDGRKFKGHGPIQITGRLNHEACGQALGIDLIKDPTLICMPEYGTRSACWFWHSRGLSPLADADNFREITRRINGGYNGWEDRVVYWKRNRAILGLPPVKPEADVRAIQAALGIAADGIYGPATKAAVVDFQRRNGLTADGIVGPQTLAALGIEEAA